MKMSDETIYRSAGFCGVLALVLLVAEIPLYLARGPMPSYLAESLSAYATRNAANMLIVAAADFVICALLLCFLAGFRHLICATQPQSAWLATQVFGAGVVYSGVTLFGDLLQSAIAWQALTGHADSSLVRTFLSSRYPAFGAMGLVFSALLLSTASYVSHTSRVLPRVTTWLGYCAAVVCLVLVPFLAAGERGVSTFFDPAQAMSTGLVAGLPVAIWMLVVGVALFRLRGPEPARI
jgi:hypothetical protein